METSLDTLAADVWRLFLQARTARFTNGMDQELRFGVVRHAEFNEIPLEKSEEDNDEEPCEDPIELESIADVCETCKERSAFDGVASLLTKVKIYEYMASVTKAYAAIGDKPFKLEATKNAPLPDEKMDEAAEVFYEFLEGFLEANQVTTDDIEQAFDMDSLRDIGQTLSDIIRDDVNDQSRRSIQELDTLLGAKFKATELMREYIKALEDTAYYPLGILWVSSNKMKKQHVIKGRKLKVKWTPQPTVERVHPKDFWATTDWMLDKQGSACFRRSVFSHGDLLRLKNTLVKFPAIQKNIVDLIDEYPSGHSLPSASLFSDDLLMDRRGEFDVLVARGRFEKKLLKTCGVEFNSDYVLEEHVACEVWYAGDKVINIDLIPIEQMDMGVYTTVFRSNGDSLWGTSLSTFIEPFAKLYEGTIKSLDGSVAQAVGAILSLDTGVMDHVERYFTVDEKTGAHTLDLSGITLLPFNSTRAMGSPNFKGVPLNVDQIPSSLDKLIPVLNVVFDQLERITGIPSLITSGIPPSSGIRTDSTFNQAYEAAGKPIQAILRESETRMLFRIIQYFYTAIWIEGVPKELIDLKPEILLSDQLTRDRNDLNKSKEELMFLAQFQDRMPVETFNGLLNLIGTEIGIEGDLIPNANPITKSSTNQINPV